MDKYFFVVGWIGFVIVSSAHLFGNLNIADATYLIALDSGLMVTGIGYKMLFKS